MRKNKLDSDYLEICANILENGHEKTDRTGTGTISIFGENITHDMSNGFPLLTTKKMAWKTMVVELLWFLKGDTNIKYLLDNGCNIWNGDCYKHYKMEFEKGNATGKSNLGVRLGVENKDEILTKDEFIDFIKNSEELGSEDFANKWGDLGPIYGKQWRAWGGNVKTQNHGFITKNDGQWFIKWSDLHSFLGGYDWTYTPIKNHHDLIDSDINREVNFDFVNSDYFNSFAVINENPKKVYVNHIDQISNVIKLLKTNPDSRRMYVSAWNPKDMGSMVLPPCHYGFQFYTRVLSDSERWDLCQKANPLLSHHDNIHKDFDSLDIPKRAISLKWNQRSCDLPLGIPFNIASYGLLLHIIAKMVNMVPSRLIGSLGDCHIYNNQIEGVEEQRTRSGYELPELVISDDVNFDGTIDDFLNSCSHNDFKIKGYVSHPRINYPLSN